MPYPIRTHRVFNVFVYLCTWRFRLFHAVSFNAIVVQFFLRQPFFFHLTFHTPRCQVTFYVLLHPNYCIRSIDYLRVVYTMHLFSSFSSQNIVFIFGHTFVACGIFIYRLYRDVFILGNISCHDKHKLLRHKLTPHVQMDSHVIDYVSSIWISACASQP